MERRNLIRARGERSPSPGDIPYFHCDATLAFEHEELHALRQIWQMRAEGRRAPSRVDFDARILKPYLRNMLIVERVFVDSITRRYRARLAGSAIVELIGELTGKFLDETLPRELLARWFDVYDDVLDSGLPMRVVCDFRSPQLSYLCGETLLAPLADTRSELTLALSCVYFAPKVQ